ncbi:membrane protein [Cruoricaptor ignavus]|uniref:Membrane protein n=1 Tax=Cruoricaptor ignavus TaxID=1118202 RepID=A0A1M6BUJ9_9FLAO|nr:YihY/virulence factor BrkB family protein [Cruoricaptor ignavus]SHI52472.1 membrane protein [Cruoricaptor ignavus]
MAAGISWAFFMSLFPLILFLLSLLPYLPHYEELQEYILTVLLSNILPENVYGQVRSYIVETFIPNIENLSPLTVLFSLIFATNGTHQLVDGFNHNRVRRSFIKDYSVSLLITSLFIAALILSILGIYYAEVVTKLLNSEKNLSWIAENLTAIISFVSFPLFYFLLLSGFYWLGTERIHRWVHALPGALLTTVLFMLVTYLFAIFLKNFARYNVLYGSIGTMIALMVWVNLNIIIILLGNELNLSVRKMKNTKVKIEHSDPATPEP